MKIHVDQHMILSSLMEYVYTGINARSKVHHVMEGIKTKELNSVKTQIMASTTLRNDFDACVMLYKDYIKQMQSSQTSEVNISALGMGGMHQSEVEDQYMQFWRRISRLIKERHTFTSMKQPSMPKKFIRKFVPMLFSLLEPSLTHLNS